MRHTTGKTKGTGPHYRVFTRKWWKDNPAWPNGLEPCATGKRRTVARGLTLEEAREVAQEWNRTHEPGRYSVKAEFEAEGA